MIKKYTIAFLFVATTIVGFCYIYVFQNKYSMADKSNLQFIVNCEIFPDVLYTPEQLHSTSIQPITTWIGEYANFSIFHENRNGMGSATYRMVVHNQFLTPKLAIYIQEPFTETKVYINGKLYDQQKDIQDYFITFTAKEKNEIVIQTTNTSHYYSGLYYPIAIGSVESVQHIMMQRTLFYGCLCFTSLTLGIYNIALWFHDRKRFLPHLNKFFGLLSISFSFYCLYPFIKLIGINSTSFTYALEDGAMMLSLAFIVQIISYITRKASKWLIPIAYGMCGNAILIPLFVLPFFPIFLPTYSFILTSYKFIIALYLVYLSIKAYKQTITNHWLTYGCIWYAFCLLAHMVTLGSYEPIRFGWYEEYGVFGLVLCFAKLMMNKSHAIVLQNEQLRNHLQEEVQTQTQQIKQLLVERQQLLAQMLHDLKKPMSTANLYIQLLKDKRMSSDYEQEELRVLERKYDDMMNQIKQMQEFNHSNVEHIQVACMDVHSFLREFYELYKLDCDALGLHFEIHISGGVQILGDVHQLERVFQNLLFNSFEHTSMGNAIRIATSVQDETITITFQDEGEGIEQQHVEHIFERRFTTDTSGDNSGLGLYIVKSILVLHHGDIRVQSTVGKGTTFFITLPIYIKRSK